MADPTPAPADAAPADPVAGLSAALAQALVKLLAAPAPGGLSPDAAAAYLGAGRTWLDDAEKKGLTPAPRRIGAKVIYDRAELDAWLAHGCPRRKQWEPTWRKLRTGR